MDNEEGLVFETSKSVKVCVGMQILEYNKELGNALMNGNTRLLLSTSLLIELYPHGLLLGCQLI